MERVHTIIIGAGIVGAGVAYALRAHAAEVFVIEAMDQPGTGMSSRNSGVIHAGIYYPVDSLKTKLCRRGAELIYRFAAEYGVVHERTGKYIVASSPAELDHLTWMKGHVQGVPLHEVEDLPKGISAQRALFSPNTGIVDQHGLINALFDAAETVVLYEQRVEHLTLTAEGVALRIAGEDYHARQVINCTGLDAPQFAQGHRHYFARGSYFQVRIPNWLDVPHLVYPAVPKGSPSLGIHLTRNVFGEAFLGPDIQWIDEENYTVEEDRAALFVESARAYLPWLEAEHVQPAYAGIRAKLAPDQFSDFTFVREGGHGQLIHCLGIESPGLTAGMAIGEHIAQMLTF